MQMIRIMGIALTACACLCLATVAQAQNRTNQNQSNQNKSTDKQVDDKTFATKAATAGKMEVKLGQMAEQRAASADVKKFAQRMVEDHGKANKELAEIVGAPQDANREADREHQQELDRLAKLQGAEFDREYVKAQVKGHEEAVQLFETEARNGQDSRLKAFAAKYLPTIRDHLQMVRALAGKTGG